MNDLYSAKVWNRIRAHKTAQVFKSNLKTYFFSVVEVHVIFSLGIGCIHVCMFGTGGRAVLALINIVNRPEPGCSWMGEGG